MKPRSEELKRKRTTRPLSWYITWTIIFLIVSALVLCSILSLPIWQVKYVQVKGAVYFDPSKIYAQAKVPKEEKLFHIDLDEIRARFKDMVQIKKIHLRRQWPSTLVIEVTERQPFAIAIVGDTTTMIDDEGVVIARESLASSMYRLELGKLPTIRGISKSSLIDSGKKLGNNEFILIKDTITLLSRSLDISTVQIDIGNKGDITVFVEDVLKVKMGDKENMHKKTSVLSLLLMAEKNNIPRMKYVDVSIPESPVIRYK